MASVTASSLRASRTRRHVSVSAHSGAMGSRASSSRDRCPPTRPLNGSASPASRTSPPSLTSGLPPSSASFHPSAADVADLSQLSFGRRLTFRTHEHLVEPVTRAHDLRTAARARVADLAADLHVRPDLRSHLGWQLVLHDFDGTIERLTYRSVQPVELPLVERCHAALRVELCLPQDLVGVRVPDTRDEVAAHQQVTQLAPRRLRAHGEFIRGPRQRACLWPLAVESGQIGGGRPPPE